MNSIAMMTRKQHHDRCMRAAFSAGRTLRPDDVADEHSRAVRSAVARGEDVPTAVLQDYPAFSATSTRLKRADAAVGRGRLDGEMLANVFGSSENFSAERVDQFRGYAALGELLNPQRPGGAAPAAAVAPSRDANFSAERDPDTALASRLGRTVETVFGAGTRVSEAHLNLAFLAAIASGELT